MVSGMRLAETLDLCFLAKKTAGFVGADLSALTKEAALHAVQRAFSGLHASGLTSRKDIHFKAISYI